MLTTQLLEKLRPMIGFRANELEPGEEGNDIGEPLKATSTGITVDQCHELLQLPTLFATAPQRLASFDDYLTQTRDDAIRTLLTTLDTRFAEVGLNARLLSPSVLFKGIVSAPPMIVPLGRVVGLLLEPLRTDVTVSLDRLQFTGSFAQGFSLSLTCIETGEAKTIVVTTPGQWQDLGLQLRTGYSYLLTYSETSLGVGNSAKNTLTSWPKPKSNCQSCQNGCLSSYVSVSSVVVSNGVTTITSDTNYGLNLVVSAEGDVSGRLVDNPARLLPALRQQMAMSFLEKIAYTTRKNPETEDAREGALFAMVDKENANRVPILLDRAIASLVKGMQAEASAAIDVNESDDITWGSI
ncbi:hypothetical protein [Spirosoma radiotolerans]|uniref:Uncharacterized protein n=1 Tax=Spirosoma radiotolerans TaxID=1379870 RepID=A0A0E3V6H5_9BACT|nr:hypothetical protein [Spirosoma radiotolerans]AKD55027.1 hypothetical protein SD10_09040 [Spirosoma radiotolerans]